MTSSTPAAATSASQEAVATTTATSAVAVRPNRQESNLCGRICTALTPSRETCVYLMGTTLAATLVATIFYKFANPTTETFNERCDMFSMSKSMRTPGITFCNEMTSNCYLNGKSLTAGHAGSNIISFEGQTCKAMQQILTNMWNSLGSYLRF